MDFDYPAGLDPYAARQHLLHHTYSPLISIQASHNADVHIRATLDNPNVSFLQFIKPYGNNAKYTAPGQTFKITNTQLITKLYPSFPVRFELSLPELLSIMRASQLSATAANVSSASVSDTKLHQLFSISSLELLLKHKARGQQQQQRQAPDAAADGGDNPAAGEPAGHEPTAPGHRDLYLDFFTKIITSNKIVPFETFNHPVSQIFAIDFHNDAVEDLRKLIVDFRNYNFPKFFQIDDLLIHVFVLYDPDVVADAKDVAEFQNTIRKTLSVHSTALPIPTGSPPEAAAAAASAGDSDGVAAAAASTAYANVSTNENATIEEELQRITLKQTSEPLRVPVAVDAMIRKRIYEYINKFLIPHMERKIRLWDDSVLAPKKSITGRFFSVSKIFFNNSSNNSSKEDHSSASSTSSASFNHQENYYHKSSPEQIIRKLADWSLILKDFKYSYSTYDLIKKDYTNNKAWVYVASVQEICIASLLLAQTQQQTQASALSSSQSQQGGGGGGGGGAASELLQSSSLSSASGGNSAASTPPPPPAIPDRNTFRKIRHDIIEPYCDNLLYTFKSRFSLKSYGIKAMLIFIELLLCLSIHHNNSWWWNDLIENYLYKCIDDFEKHFVTGGQVIRALLYERLGYCFGRCMYLDSTDSLRWVQRRPLPGAAGAAGGSDGTVSAAPSSSAAADALYENPHKIQNRSLHFSGLTKFRRSSLWYLLSIKEWLELKNYAQVEYLLQNVRYSYNIKEITGAWYDRNDLLLGFTKRVISEASLRERAVDDNDQEQAVSAA